MIEVLFVGGDLIDELIVDVFEIKEITFLMGI